MEAENQNAKNQITFINIKQEDFSNTMMEYIAIKEEHNYSLHYSFEHEECFHIKEERIDTVDMDYYYSENSTENLLQYEENRQSDIEQKSTNQNVIRDHFKYENLIENQNIECKNEIGEPHIFSYIYQAKPINLKPNDLQSPDTDRIKIEYVNVENDYNVDTSNYYNESIEIKEIVSNIKIEKCTANAENTNSHIEDTITNLSANDQSSHREKDLRVECKNEIDIEEHMLCKVKEEPMSDMETPPDGSCQGYMNAAADLKDTAEDSADSLSDWKDGSATESALTTHTAEGKHEWDVCKFAAKSNINRHKRTSTDQKTYECEICQKKFNQKSNLGRHMRLHTGEKPYQCDICRKEFRYNCILKSHMRLHTGEKPYECEICQKKFTYISSFHNHMRSHTGKKPYECKICRKRFTQNVSLTRHMFLHTDKKSYECEICLNKFSQSSHLHRHMQTHTSKKSYVCEICQKKFIHSSTLHRHMRVHTGEKPYGCEICQRKFSLKSNLLFHLRTHTGEKPYECEICQKKCSLYSNLRSHMRIHSVIQPYECKICHQKFIQERNLHKHELIHTGEKHHECGICQKKFPHKYRLKKHMLIHSVEKP